MPIHYITELGSGKSIPSVIYYYLQLLYREVKGILLYQGFPRPILHNKLSERREGCLVSK